jgi:pilus assembly protein CpaB
LLEDELEGGAVRRRIVTVFVAVGLAVLGGVLLLRYVSAADQRALAGMQTTQVLVVTQPVPDGTSADKLSGLVEMRTLPSMAVVPGAVSNLSELSGRVTTTELQPGEQVLASRFADPATAAGGVAVPSGMQQVSVLLEPQRVVAGDVAPGATVGVFLSTAEKPLQTHLTLHKVLVTKVQGGLSAAPSDGSEAAEPDLGGNVMVTLATTAANAEKIVFAAEHGSIWLSAEPDDASTSGTSVVTEGNIYR